MLANRPAALAHLKKYLPETDDATLEICLDALSRRSARGPADAIRRRQSAERHEGDRRDSDDADTAEGVLWTNAYNK
jgi:hypothetical protein